VSSFPNPHENRMASDIHGSAFQAGFVYGDVFVGATPPDNYESKRTTLVITATVLTVMGLTLLGFAIFGPVQVLFWAAVAALLGAAWCLGLLWKHTASNRKLNKQVRSPDS
jgi:hypothetical protein